MSDTLLDQQLAQFRRTYPAMQVRHEASTWRYHRGGSGADAILWLTGVLGIGEFAFPRALQLGARYRVLAPDYPAVQSLDGMADGLVAILDAERIAKAHVIGGSFGGMLAQHLVRRHRARVRSLVLSHTSAPMMSPMGSALVSALRFLPGRLLHALFRRRLRPAFPGDESFWTRYFDECLTRLDARAFRSRIVVGAQFARGHYTPGDLATWPGNILMLESDDDPLMSAASRQALRALYPRAQTYTFNGTGHATAILRPAEWVDVVSEFLDSVRSSS